MPKSLNQLGFAPVLTLLLLLGAIVAGIYLVGKQTNLFPQAAKKDPYYLKQYPSENITLVYPMYYGEESSGAATMIFEDEEKSEPAYVTLKQTDGRDVPNKAVSYSWSINDQKIAEISPYSQCFEDSVPPKEQVDSEKDLKEKTRKKVPEPKEDKEDKPKDKDCPQNYLSINPLKVGNTEITVNAVNEKTKKLLASAKFNLSVIANESPEPSCVPAPDCVYTKQCEMAPVPGIVWCKKPKPSGKICKQVITRACSAGEISPPLCKDFPTPCDVPDSWVIQK